MGSARLPDECPLVNIDESISDDMSAPLPDVAPYALAYLFYTSGSAGQPKGVCHSHRNLLYFIGCYSKADAEMHYNLDVVIKEQGRMDVAVTSYRKVIKLKPDEADILEFLVFAYDGQNTNQ